MIDRTSRNRLAENFRHLVSGRITNAEFASGSPFRSFDPAIWTLFEWANSFYSDDREYRLRGKYAIPREFRRDVARAIVFLYSDQEYEWPKFPRMIWPIWGMWGLAFYLVIGLVMVFCGVAVSPRVKEVGSTSLGVVGIAIIGMVVFHLVTRRARVREGHKWRAYGDFDVWPFVRSGDFAKSRKCPTLLSGKSPPRDWDWL